MHGCVGVRTCRVAFLGLQYMQGCIWLSTVHAGLCWVKCGSCRAVFAGVQYVQDCEELSIEPAGLCCSE